MKKREELEKLRDMSDEDLQAEAERLKESLFRLNFKLALGEVDAVKRIRQEKKSLARIQTLVRERQQAEAA
jgi:large subunit ribosomal protein L29